MSGGSGVRSQRHRLSRLLESEPGAKTSRTATCRWPRVELARCEDGKILADKIKDKLEMTASLTGLDYGRFTRSMLLSQGQFAAFLNAKPKERAELLEELTGTEIYGQISAQVFEKHKQARVELEKIQAQASGVLLLSDDQQQALQQSLQALTDEEKQKVSEQSRLQNARQWLVRRAELTAEDLQAQSALREAQSALEQAQPQLTVLLNAQPAEHLRPQWTRQQEQTTALAANPSPERRSKYSAYMKGCGGERGFASLPASSLNACRATSKRSPHG
ncbi:exonuclease SbcC [Klebsiella oxytoca]|nr:exonuclease SbcC [Klebsiella oxytoca]